MKPKPSAKVVSPAKPAAKDKPCDKNVKQEQKAVDVKPEVPKPEIQTKNEENPQNKIENHEELAEKQKIVIGKSESSTSLSTRVHSLANLRNSLVLISKRNK